MGAAAYCAGRTGLTVDDGLRRGYFSYNHSDSYVSDCSLRPRLPLLAPDLRPFGTICSAGRCGRPESECRAIEDDPRSRRCFCQKSGGREARRGGPCAAVPAVTLRPDRGLGGVLGSPSIVGDAAARPTAVFVPAERSVPAPWPWSGRRRPGGDGRRAGGVASRGRQVRRVRVAAERRSLAAALPDLVALPVDAPGVSPSLAAWSVAAKVAVDLVARGRIIPSIGAGGTAVWRIGPIDPADHRLLDELAAAMPPEAHALPLPNARPLRIRSARSLLDAFVDAVADRLVRTPAAEVAGGGLFAEPVGPSPVDPVTAAWLANATSGTADRAYPGLRLSLPDDPDDPDEHEGAYTATVQCAHLEPSLIIDAATCGRHRPVLTRLGNHADVDLLVPCGGPPGSGRRSGDSSTNTAEVLRLADDEAVDLLGETAEQLAPRSRGAVAERAGLGRGSLRTVVSTPSPTGVADPVIQLDQLLQPRWEAVLGADPDPDELDLLARPAAARAARGPVVLADPEMAARLRRRAKPLQAAKRCGGLAGQLTIDGEEVESGSRAGWPTCSAACATTTPASCRAARPRRHPRPYQRRGLAGGRDDLARARWLPGRRHGLARRAAHRPAPIAIFGGRRRPPFGPTLVGCPASLLGNWEREIGRFAPPSRCGATTVATGTSTTSPATRSCSPHTASCAGHAPWPGPVGLVVADEAQHARPVLRTARRSGHPVTRRVALTAPHENRLTELWSLLDWRPGLLGPLDASAGWSPCGRAPPRPMHEASAGWCDRSCSGGARSTLASCPTSRRRPRPTRSSHSPPSR